MVHRSWAARAASSLDVKHTLPTHLYQNWESIEWLDLSLSFSQDHSPREVQWMIFTGGRFIF